MFELDDNGKSDLNYLQQRILKLNLISYLKSNVTRVHVYRFMYPNLLQSIYRAK